MIVATLCSIGLAVSVTPSNKLRPISFQSLKCTDELTDLPLELVEGALPTWLRGTLFRNGPGAFDVGEQRLNHLFDGYAMMGKINLDSDEPRISTRFVRSSAHEGFASGSQDFAEFGTPRRRPSNPLELLASLFELIFAAPTDNASVNTIKLADGRRLALTETERGTFVISEADLSTVERFEWHGASTGQLNTAHPMPLADGGFVNVGTVVGSPLCSYNVFRTHATTPDVRELIASIPCANRAAPCWLHSFGLTATRAIVLEQPTPYDLPAMLGMATAEFTCLKWRPQDGVRVHLVDLATGAVDMRVAPPFFFFHIANAFDAPNGSVCVDLALYDDPSIVEALRLERLSGTDEVFDDLPRSRLTRLTIPSSPSARVRLGALDDVEETGGFVDFPVIHPDRAGDAAYEYVWGIAADRPTRAANRLVKLTVRGGEKGGERADGVGGGGDDERRDHSRGASFARPNCYPSEPVYVPRPGAEAEDDGVLLSLLNDEAERTTSLVVLDAASLALQARLKLPMPLPYGFHGDWLQHAQVQMHK